MQGNVQCVTIPHQKSKHRMTCSCTAGSRRAVASNSRMRPTRSERIGPHLGQAAEKSKHQGMDSGRLMHGQTWNKAGMVWIQECLRAY